MYSVFVVIIFVDLFRFLTIGIRALSRVGVVGNYFLLFSMYNIYILHVMYLNRSTNIITTNTKYTIDPQSKIEEATLYYYQTLEVGKHLTMDPIMEGILSYSLASSRGLLPIELPLQIQ